KELSNAIKKDLSNIKSKQKEDLERSAKMDKIKELEVVVAERDATLAEMTITLAEMKTKLDEFTAKAVEVEKAEKEKSDLNKSELEAKLVEASEKLVEASEKIEGLVSQVEELSTYKEKFDAIEAEKAEVAKVAKVAELKVMATKGGYITEAELESDEAIKTMISECNEQEIKNLRAERILDSVETSNAKEVAEKELAEKEAKGKLELPEENKIDKNAMSAFLK
ncbi:unnamed protein product, partial [marine sediment metagenome]